MFRMLALVAALGLAAAVPQGARAQSAAEAEAIETVILNQIEAMQVDDWDLAFTFASPTIQGIFGDPGNFSRMVMNGYPMVWRPADVRVGQLTASPQGLVQTMLFEDQQGRFYVADYYMQMVDGVWRINGVQIRPAEAGAA